MNFGMIVDKNGYEIGYATFKAGEAIVADDVVTLSLTAADGITVIQPVTAALHLTVGVADKAAASGGSVLVQTYGYRGTSKIRMTDSTYAAGARLVAVNAQDYFYTQGSGDTFAYVLETVATGTTTTTKKIFIRAL